MDLVDSLHISAAGMRVQGVRLRVVAENMANADSVAATAGGQPYRRKVVTFENVLDRSLGLETVRVAGITREMGELQKRYSPTHPAADKDGYILMPNVNSLIEMTDMREAQRSYEANLKVLEAARSMLMKTIDLLR